MTNKIEIISAPLIATLKNRKKVHANAIFYNNESSTKAWIEIIHNGKNIINSIKKVAYTHKFYLKGWLTPEIKNVGITVSKNTHP